jgi:hypothetical protein
LGAQLSARKLETGQGYDRRGITSSAKFCAAIDAPAAEIFRGDARNFLTISSASVSFDQYSAPLEADVVEVVRWKIGALFSRAAGSQIGTILK